MVLSLIHHILLGRMYTVNLSKSIDFLLENASDVIKYRLHKEILKDITKTEEENMLEKVLQTPFYKLVESYVKPNGYIGCGMHSWSNWRGTVLHQTPLQDGEAAARLFSNYAIPKDKDIVKNFVAAIRNDDVLQKEFSYIPPELQRFENRYLGLANGSGLMVLIYTMQALLGFDDEFVKTFVDISYEAFRSVLNMNSLDDITRKRSNTSKKYNYPYIEYDQYFPCQYHLETLAHTTSWKNEKRVAKMVKAINHLNCIMKENNAIHVKIGYNYYVPYWAYVRPLKVFTTQATADVALRKTITNLALVGGEKIDVVRQSSDVVKKAISDDGILRVTFANSYCKKYFKQNMEYPGPYSEVSLETEHKTNMQIWCDLTFWAVQLLHILKKSE